MARIAVRTAAALLAGVACATPPRPAATPPPPGAPYVAADVAFMQDMIAHHAQALEMVALVPGRSELRGMERMAERISATQVAEIAQMERWLTARGEATADPDRHADHDAAAHARMPGMASEEELRRLSAASGPDFDRRFLQLMIRHHEGALTMVADLFATESAGQEPELFRLASDVDADQRAVIARMTRMLTTLDEGSP